MIVFRKASDFDSLKNFWFSAWNLLWFSFKKQIKGKVSVLSF
jgi:hypothetical protein